MTKVGNPTPSIECVNSVGGKDQFDEVFIELHRTDKENPSTNEEAMASLVISVKSMNHLP